MAKQFNEAQRQAVEHLDGPALVLAGPGSGKTTVIVERLCRLLERGIPGGNIMVLTFTRSAAIEMRERFFARMGEIRQEYMQRQDRYPDRSLASANQVLFGTFHSAFFQILRYSGGYDSKSVLRSGEKLAILEEVSRGTGIYHDREGWYQEVLREISDVKGNGIQPETCHSLSCRQEEFAVLFRGYQEILQARKRLDFDDMLLCCHTLLQERPDLLSIWQERCRYLLIDEYQDSNRIQCQLAQMLAAPENHVMAVGDDDQSIYGFRGAAPERMKDFLAAYPDAKQYLLNINYRCPAQVVEAAGRLIARNENRLPKKIAAANIGKTSEEAGEKPGKWLGQTVGRRGGRRWSQTANERFGQAPGPGFGQGSSVVTATEYATLREENEAILTRIRQYHEGGVPYEDMAVLYRINRNPAQLIRLLEERGIPHSVKGTTGNLYTHWICQDFCAYLAVANGSTRRGDWLRVISHPERYFSRSALGQEPVTIDKLFDFYEEDRRRIDTIDRLSYDLTVLKRTAPYAGISHLRRYMGYDDYLEEMDQNGEGRIREIAEAIHETMDGCRSGEEWLRYVQTCLQQQEKADGNAAAAGAPASQETAGIHLMTMHGSKGLEFPVVFLADANEGMTPYKRADSPEAIEEERRLFYVAMTRAREHLHISWTKERFHRPQGVSRFVEEAVGLGMQSPFFELSDIS